MYVQLLRVSSCTVLEPSVQGSWGARGKEEESWISKSISISKAKDDSPQSLLKMSQELYSMLAVLMQ